MIANGMDIFASSGVHDLYYSLNKKTYDVQTTPPIAHPTYFRWLGSVEEFFLRHDFGRGE